MCDMDDVVCKTKQFRNVVRQNSHLVNDVFNYHNIPALIKLYETSEEMEQLNKWFTEGKVCSHEVEFSEVPIVVLDINKEIVGCCVLTVYPRCLYFSYTCVSPRFQKMGWGQFVTFLGIFFALRYGAEAIFSMGVSDIKTTTKYSRVGDYNEIDVSQHLKITTFGFEDMYKKETYTIERMKSFAAKCGAYAETALDLVLGELRLYEAYKTNFVDNGRKVFQAFISSQKQSKRPFVD